MSQTLAESVTASMRSLERRPDERSGVAVFAFPPELEVFKGHFPGQPLVPGVFLIEAARTAAEACRGLAFTIDEVKDARFTGEVLLTRDQMNLKSQVLDLRSAAEEEYAFTASGQVLIWNSEWTGSGDRLFSRGEKEPYHLESDSGMATVTSLASGSILRGARLLIHPEDGKAEVESLPGGRITIRSPATDQGEAGR